MKVVTNKGEFKLTFKHDNKKAPNKTEVTLTGGNEQLQLNLKVSVKRYHTDESNSAVAEIFGLNKILELVPAGFEFDYKTKADFQLALLKS